SRKSWCRKTALPRSKSCKEKHPSRVLFSLVVQNSECPEVSCPLATRVTLSRPARPSRPVFKPESFPIESTGAYLPALTPDRLPPDGLRARFEQRLRWEQEPREVRWNEDVDPRVAAVLIPVVERDSGLTVLLTQRADHLSDHAGQVSFPGGRHEPTDADTI